MNKRLATIDMRQKLGAVPPPFGGRLAGSSWNTMWPRAEVYHRTKWHLDPSSRLATTNMGQNLGGALLLFRRGAGSPSNTKWPGPRRTSISSCIFINPAVFPQQTWAENWGLCLFWGDGSLSSAMWPEMRPTSIPSGILIHPAIWPQQIWAQNWRAVSLWGGGAGSHLIQCGQGRAIPACQVSS